LKELYAANGQTGYIASNRVDFTVTLPEAFKVFACAV